MKFYVIQAIVLLCFIYRLARGGRLGCYSTRARLRTPNATLNTASSDALIVEAAPLVDTMAVDACVVLLAIESIESHVR